MAEMSVLELVEAFTKAKADLASAVENEKRLNKEISRLTPFEGRVAELEAELGNEKELSKERAKLGTQFGTERDEARKAAAAAEKGAKAARDERESFKARVAELEVEVAEAKGALKDAQGRVRELEKFEKAARPVFEAADSLRAVLADASPR